MVSELAFGKGLAELRKVDCPGTADLADASGRSEDRFSFADYGVKP